MDREEAEETRQLKAELAEKDARILELEGIIRYMYGSAGKLVCDKCFDRNCSDCDWFKAKRILKKGGCWDTCKSGKMSAYYISELDYEKARHKKAVEIEREINKYLRSMWDNRKEHNLYWKDHKNKIIEIIKRHL